MEKARNYSGKPMPAGFEIKWQVVPFFHNIYQPPTVDDPSREYITTVAQNLSNTRYTLEIITDDKGTVPIEAIGVYRPPLGPPPPMGVPENEIQAAKLYPRLVATNPMRIAFDIDQTLIPYDQEFSVERSVPIRIFKPFFKESLRQGTIGLLRQLQAQGCDIWIYTTSGRTSSYLRMWFLLLGIRIGGVVNCHRHTKEVRSPYRSFPNCSKYPPAFGIDLLVDDSEGVVLEGQRHGFSVILVEPSDRNWTERVLEAITNRG